MSVDSSNVVAVPRDILDKTKLYLSQVPHFFVQSSQFLAASQEIRAALDSLCSPIIDNADITIEE